MARGAAGMVWVALLVLTGAPAGAGGATLRTEVRAQAQEVCEVAQLSGGRLLLRCTAGMAPPQEPRLLPGMPAAVRALGPLRLEAVHREASGAELMEYVPLPAAALPGSKESGRTASTRVFWFD
ncbi:MULTISPECIES: hypothetical protein [Deinococcus]|uniref:hypothetical protein n=1 Tax=Deinococcus TaxID=1298 RepID=UPI0004D79B9C|nr:MULTISPECIES: hypothetical protein [Deinococcus]KEF34327.1 hypothetical protein RDMS_07945 [Deinococcus sp. RL]